MTGVADEILKLRFTAGPLQSLYLNNDRVNERFTSHLGAITAWTRSAEMEGGGGIDLKIVKADARAKGGNQITYGVEDALVRALLLRDALQAAGVIHSPESATVGQYVLASGRSCLRHPQAETLYPPNLQLHDMCIQSDDARYTALEFDRARAEAVRLALAGPASSNDRMWLLMLTEGNAIRVAAVLNSLWINDAVISYLHANWTMFGTLRESIGGVPLLAAIHVWVEMPENVMASMNVG